MNIAPISKDNFSNLGDSEKRFFENIHNFFEIKGGCLKCKPWSEVKGILKKHNVYDGHDTRSNPIQIIKAASNSLYFNVWKGKGVSINFIRHLRNAFAHLYIERDSKSGELHLQDWSGKGKRCTMDMKISFPVLKELVEALLGDKTV